MPTRPPSAPPAAPARLPRIALTHGCAVALLATLVAFAPWFVVGASTAWLDVRELLNLAVVLACPLAVVMALRTLRDAPGGLTGGRAFLAGAAVATVAALLAGLLAYVLLSVIGDALPQALFDAHADALRAAGGADIDARMAILERGRPMLFSPVLQAVGTAALLLLAGLVAAAVSAPVLRTRDAA